VREGFRWLSPLLLLLLLLLLFVSLSLLRQILLLAPWLSLQWTVDEDQV